jgi:hypothetical protein
MMDRVCQTCLKNYLPKNYDRWYRACFAGLKVAFLGSVVASLHNKNCIWLAFPDRVHLIHCDKKNTTKLICISIQCLIKEKQKIMVIRNLYQSIEEIKLVHIHFFPTLNSEYYSSYDGLKILGSYSFVENF